jgi:DNA-directed RNA polymerase subunit beta
MAASEQSVLLPERVSFARIPDRRTMSGLIQVQLDSVEWLKKEGLRDLFEEISLIEDFTGKNLKRECIRKWGL